MATITEDYVSFETAKLLKEKGFNGDTASCYILEDSTHHIMSDKVVQSEYYESQDSNEHGHLIQAPTLQMAMKWLREVHKKWITITFHWHTVDGETTLYYSPYIMLSEYKNVILEDKNPFKIKLFTSYEEACEEAIKYCLENLI